MTGSTWQDLPGNVFAKLVDMHCGVAARMQTVCRSWQLGVHNNPRTKLILPDFRLPANLFPERSWCVCTKDDPPKVRLTTALEVLRRADPHKVSDIEFLLLHHSETDEEAAAVCSTICGCLYSFSGLVHLSLRTFGKGGFPRPPNLIDAPPGIRWRPRHGFTNYAAVQFLPASLQFLEIDICVEQNSPNFNSLRWFNSLINLQSIKIVVCVDNNGGYAFETPDTFVQYDFLMHDLRLPCLQELDLQLNYEAKTEIIAPHLSFQHLPLSCSIECSTIGLLHPQAGLRVSLTEHQQLLLTLNIEVPSSSIRL